MHDKSGGVVIPPNANSELGEGRSGRGGGRAPKPEAPRRWGRGAGEWHLGAPGPCFPLPSPFRANRLGSVVVILETIGAKLKPVGAVLDSVGAVMESVRAVLE